jgi:hypothetical protein
MSHYPAFVALAVDSLGKNKLSVSSLRPLTPVQGPEYALSRIPARSLNTGLWARPRLRRLYGRSNAQRAACICTLPLPQRYPPPCAGTLNFNPHINHATLLGL